MERLLQMAGADVAGVLLDSLGSADSRATRRQILARLEEMSDSVLGSILARLEAGPWYVQRNMLYLISRMENVPVELDTGRWLRHGDVRVRRDAIRVGLRMTEWRGRAMEAGLADSDTRTVSLVLGAAAEACPEEIVPSVIRLLDTSSLDPSLRVLAVRALGQVDSHLARSRLVRVASGRRRLWWRRTLAPRSPELMAALSALAFRWSASPEAATVLRLAAQSTDPEIRAAVRHTGSRIAA